VIPSVFRKVEGVVYERERIDTPDCDFLDLDWSAQGNSRLGIVLHGMEGDSGRSYVKGMARVLNRSGRDAVAMNFRGCSGECNRLPRFYHGGDTPDLHTVVEHVIRSRNYSEIALIGFSMGGNLILKYLGERAADLHPSITAAVVFSVPCDIAASVERIGSRGNRVYVKRFLRMLKKKIVDKSLVMPEAMSPDAMDRIRTLEEFDDHYTSRMHGFSGVGALYAAASCKPYLRGISIPTLLVNAADDPFLSEECYPLAEAEANDRFFLEIPKHGGHTGFMSLNDRNEYWSESRAVSFLDEQCG
jgi:predicted alpha/beta-fold hydrolase